MKNKVIDMKKEIKEDLKLEISRLKEENSKLNIELTKIKNSSAIDEMSVLTDKNNISGIGTITLFKNYFLMKIDPRELEKALKIFKVFNEDRQYDSIHIAVGTDLPLILGNYDKNKKKISGIIIAPRVEE